MDKNKCPKKIPTVTLPRDLPVALQIERGITKETKPYMLPGGTYVRPLPPGVKL